MRFPARARAGTTLSARRAMVTGGDGQLTNLPAQGSRRRKREQPRRDIVIRVKVTAGEAAAIKAAADRARLSAGAWIGDVLISAAEHRAAPVDDLMREALHELIRLSGLTRRAGANLNQAVARLNATGQPGPDLAPAADWVARVARNVDDAATAITTRLLTSTRRTRSRPRPDGPAEP
jgi:hypothetical protein